MKWEDYYKKIAGRTPRPLLIDVLEHFQPEQNANRQAIDLGCGDGTETAFLIKQGWHVLAVDGAAESRQFLLEKVPTESVENLQIQIAKFEKVQLIPADLVYAGYSLPFCPPQHFDAFWQKIAQSLKPDAHFAGQFFGIRDSWANNPDMTFHSDKQVRSLLKPFEIEHFHEQDEDGMAASGPKHWHVFTVIAKKTITI